LGGLWPIVPFFSLAVMWVIDPGMSQQFTVYLWRSSPTLAGLLAGTGLIILGNAIDVWGYGVLFRSFSIVPEARELKVTGVYRFMRHPIYFGQMLAQAGVWLFFANVNLFSVSFLALFVALQLVRAKLEDRVLEDAFGDRYRDWKDRTFWFA
ncbi:MAG: isoprenylcysteine carboxylmethyltransferase family protein, partial [Planctomycetales bacterium]|nr:isoprenylcysteine carboxylmethyltransferase family protein [Planctomycetales bacterium]